MLNPLNLSKIAEFIQGAAAASAGTSTVTGATIDIRGYEGCLIVAKLGDVTATSVLNLKAQGGSASDGSDAADLTGAGTGNLTAAAADYDSKFLIVDVIRPQTDYIRGVLARGTANAVVESLLYIPYGRKKNPVPQAQAGASGHVVATF